MKRKFNIRSILIGFVVATLMFNHISISAAVIGSTNHLVLEERTNAPITWARSSEENVWPTIEKGWTWQEASRIETPITELTQIWDAQYKAYYTGYIEGLSEALHSSATWETKNDVDLRRFKGTFSIPQGYTTEDFVRLESVNHDDYVGLNNGDIVAINDNIYVFVYPKSVEGLISDEATSPHYFMNYLAFWTGTANRAAFGIQSFYGKAGTYAVRDTENGPIVTDGWYAEATMDNIGTIMHQTTGGQGAGSEFVIDIFTEDNSPGGGGGMDEMVLEFIHNPHAEVIAKGETYAIPQGQEITVQTSEGLLANEEIGKVVTSHVLTGTYGEFRIEETGKDTYKIYRGEEVVASLNYTDERGQFKIQPEKGFAGKLAFNYVVQDKLGKSAEATANIYVMPSVEITHVDSSTGKVILKEETTYYNPYGNLPEDVIYLGSTQNIKERINIDSVNTLIGEKTLYKFRQGSIKEAEKEIAITSVPYIYNGNGNNVEVELEYDKLTTKLNVVHEYEDEKDETVYEPEAKELEPYTKINPSAYIDTTDHGVYAEDTKYEVDRIDIVKKPNMDSKQVSYKMSETKLEDELEVLGGYDYELTIKYKIKKYNIVEKYIFDDQEETQYTEGIAYGTSYMLMPLLKEGYTLEKITIDDAELPVDSESIEVDGDKTIYYYYKKKPVVPPSNGENGDNVGEIPPSNGGNGDNVGEIPPSNGESGDNVGEIPPSNGETGDNVGEMPPSNGENGDNMGEVPPSNEEDNDEIEFPDEEIPGGAVEDEIVQKPNQNGATGNQQDAMQNENSNSNSTDSANPQTGDKGITKQLLSILLAGLGIIAMYKGKSI